MDRGLQLLLLLLLAVVAIGNCLTFDSRLSGSKNSRRNHKYPHLNGEEAVLSAAAAVAVAATADYHPDYLPQESISQFTTSNNNNNNNNNNREEESEYRGGKLIGKWRSTGEAIEPKWRDGDSVPLVPFEEAATRRKVPKPREKTNPYSINYSDNVKESGKVHHEQGKVPILNFPLVITDKPGVVDGSKFYQNGGIPTPVILKTPQLPVAVPVTVPLNHEPITNKLHELHLAKLRYLNIPLTNINLPIPEIISSSEITPHNYYYTTDENNNNNNYNNNNNKYHNNNNNENNNNNNNTLRNGNKRYRTRKPKPVTKLPEEDSHTSYVEQTIQTSLSTTPITTPTLSVTTSTTPISTTITTTISSSSSPSSTPLPSTATTTTTTTSRPTTVSTSSSTNPSTLTPNTSTEKTKQVTRTSDWVNPFGNKNEYEVNDEEYQRPRPRKRRPPSNYEFQVERNRELDSERRRNRTKVSSSTSAPIPQEENSELKSLLKMQQVEGSSLSEVLQRKNLSLSDLLKRKSEVISALKSKESDYEADSGFSNITSLFNNTDAGEGKGNEEENSRRNSTGNNVDNVGKIKNSGKDSNERRWRRPFRRNKLRVNSRISTSTSTSRSPVLKEEITDELDKKKLTQEPNERKYEKLSTTKLPSPIIFPRLNSFTKKPTSTSAQPPTSAITTAIIEEAVPAEETTNEERSTTTQPDDEIMEFSDFSTIPSDIEDSTESSKDSSVTERIGNTIFAKFEDLTREVGSTLSIEHILTTQPPTKPTKVEYADDKSNNLFESDDYQNDGKDIEATTLAQGVEDYETGRPGQVYERIVSKMEPEVRAEIFELISTGSSAKRLEDILSSRNMSIDELIALRQRGSSQVHLAEISRIRPENLKNFEENEGVTAGSEVLEDKMEEEGKKEPIVIDLFGGKSEEGKKIDDKEVFDLEDLLKAFDSLPFGRNLTIDGEIVEKVSTVTSTSTTESLKYEVRNSFDDLKAKFEEDDDGLKEENLKIGKEKEVRSGKNIQVEGKLIEQEIGAVEEVIHELESLGAENTPEVFNEEEKKTLSRVRPSIIASGAILGLTIVGFLVIFIVCRIKQKQRYRYKNSFAKTVFQAPAINRKLSNSSSLNTIMVNVVATSTTKRMVQQETQQVEERFDCKSDIDNDSLDANDSWETIPDFMK